MVRTWRELAATGIMLALAITVAGAARAQSGGGFELITAAEAQQTAKAEIDAPREVRTRQMVAPRPDAPAIRVISPPCAGGGGWGLRSRQDVTVDRTLRAPPPTRTSGLTGGSPATPRAPPKGDQ